MDVTFDPQTLADDLRLFLRMDSLFSVDARPRLAAKGSQRFEMQNMEWFASTL